MSDAQAIDDLILSVLLDSPYGREWLERKAEEKANERRLLDLRNLGLRPEIVAQLWSTGSADLIDRMSGMTAAQVRRVNRAWADAQAAG